jgi:hypothetical protein
MRKRFFLPFVCAALGCLSLHARDGKTQGGLNFSQSLAGQVNPLGLSADSRLFYTLPLFPHASGPLWDASRVEAGVHNALTPAFDTLSVFVRAQPIAFFDFAASAGLRGYYDAFGYGYTPLADYAASWDSRDRKDAERFRAAGFRYGFTATLKAAAGPFVFASATSATLYDMFDAPGGRDYYYDPSADAALKRFDGFLTNDSLVMYTLVSERDFLARAGFVHTFVFVPSSDHVSRRLCLAGRLETDLGPRLEAFAAVLGGVFLRDRYNSWRDGKLYAALQTGLTVKL